MHLKPLHIHQPNMWTFKKYNDRFGLIWLVFDDFVNLVIITAFIWLCIKELNLWLTFWINICEQLNCQFSLVYRIEQLSADSFIVWSVFEMVLKLKQALLRVPNRILHRLHKILCSFCAFTSIHGANHIADDFRRFNKSSIRAKYSERWVNFRSFVKYFGIFYLNEIFFEQNSTIRLAKCSSVFFWGGTILNCILLAILMVTLIWDRMQQRPILNTVVPNYPIAKVKFPAVTFCNINVVYRPAMEKILEEL